jgi:hypothetical protein
MVVCGAMSCAAPPTRSSFRILVLRMSDQAREVNLKVLMFWLLT